MCLLQLGDGVFQGLLGLSRLDAVFVAGAVELVLLGLQLPLQAVDGVVELVHSLAVGLAVPAQLVGEGVDASIGLLVLGCGLLLLEVQFVLEGVDLGPEGQLPLLFLRLLLLLVADEVLDLLVFLPQQPVQLVDLGNQSLDLVDVAGDEVGGVLLLDVPVFHLDVHHLAAVQLLQGQDLFPEAGVLPLEGPQLLLIPVLQGLVVGELVLELSVLVVVGGFELADLFLEKEDLVGVIFLQGIDLHLFLSCPLLAGVLEFSLHIVAVPGHQAFQLVPFLLRAQSRDVLLGGELVALDGEEVDLFDLVLEHVLQLLDVPLVEFVALQSLLLEQLDLQGQRVVVLGQLPGPQCLPVLHLRDAGLEPFCLVASLGEFAGELVVVLREEGVLLDEAVDLRLQLVGLAQLYLQEGDLVEQAAVLGLAPEGGFEGELLLDEIALDADWGAARVGGGFAVV